MEAALKTAEPLAKIVNHTVIASPTEGHGDRAEDDPLINKSEETIMKYGAFGLVEVLGSSNAILVIDQMLKASEVSFRTWHTKCGGHATVFLSGGCGRRNCRSGQCEIQSALRHHCLCG